MAALASPAREQIPARKLAIVVAHPDDETVGIGGQLARLRSATIVHVTDGAPRDGEDAHRLGLSIEQYATLRREELRAAMARAGIHQRFLMELALADQTAALHLAGLARRMALLFLQRGIEIVLTHSYEGGHPDHDATAFAAHAACELLTRSGHAAPALAEMALYHAASKGLAISQFPGQPIAVGGETAIELDLEALANKRALLSIFSSQSTTLAPFTSPIERVRMAPVYDFLALPNGGRLYYESFDWGMTGRRWLGLVHRALSELELHCPL